MKQGMETILPDLERPDEIAHEETEQNLAQEELAAAQKKAEEYLSGWKRALADYENAKRDQGRIMEESKDFYVVRIINELFPIFDALEKTLEHIPEEQRNAPWFHGIDYVRTEWLKFLESYGIQHVGATGVQFDPTLHEAVETKADPEKPDNEVLAIGQSGYLMNDKIIRPARVVVNKLTS